MEMFFAWILVICACFAATPWAAWLLAKNPRHDGRWLTLTLGLALSVGALTLVMFWESLLGLPLSLPAVTLPYAALALAGWVVRRKSNRTPLPSPQPWRGREKQAAKWVAGIILLAVSGAVLFNAVYWPFYRPDAVAIYAETAHQMTELRALVPLIGRDSLYRAYPVLVPLAYTYTYLASGWENEYLAKLIPALLSLGCLPVVYTFGRALRGSTAGWLSAGLLALTPMFPRWASSGYVDLPMAFFYALAALFAWRLWQTGHWTDALLAGLMMGLAAFTKNAALLGILFLGVWLTAALVRRRIGWQWAVLSLAACALVAAPWYVRNLIGAQMLIPATAWTDQAERTLTTLLAFVTYSGNFGLPGYILLVGVATAGIEFIAGVRRSALPPDPSPLGQWEMKLSTEFLTGNALLLLLTVPFFIAWWLFVSYDPRFLLLFLPLLAVMAGLALVRLGELFPARWRNPLVIAAALLALVLAALVVWNSVDYKTDILRRPLMNNSDKHALVLANRR